MDGCMNRKLTLNNGASSSAVVNLFKNAGLRTRSSSAADGFTPPLNTADAFLNRKVALIVDSTIRSFVR
ncbi:hypothetical protein MD484_g7565, partial [Candolleomyces efflorescens]